VDPRRHGDQVVADVSAQGPEGRYDRIVVAVHEASARLQRVRSLVLAHGWNSTVYQILNPGIEHWLPENRDTVVGFVRGGRNWIAAGAPVCEPSRLRDEAICFELAAKGHGSRVCYFGAMERTRHAVGEDGHHAVIAIGAQPVWDPRGWPDLVKRRSSLRAQLNRARNKGVSIVIPPVRPVPYRAELQACLAQWLDARPLPPMHFLVEPDTLGGVLEDRRLYVATREGFGVAAFLVASPVPLRNGFLIEQIARGQNCPNGTAELLIDAAMRDLGARGHTYVTQGLVALSNHARDAMRDNPLWLRALMAWARAHGNRFYNFRGLEAFRTKMEPDAWETVYAISAEQSFSPETLHAVALAFCQGSPLAALARATVKAARQELRWLVTPRRDAKTS
jgi:phosphatidylglycerol lysyltransferase